MPNAIKYKTGNLTGSIEKSNVALGISAQGPTSTTGWYSGLTPDSNRYVVYKTDASNTPRIFYPADENELIRLAKQEGATGANTGSAASVLSWMATQTNLMAANLEYENIVTSELVLNYDAGFVGSYPTTASTWYDISGNSNNGTLTNGPTYSSSNGGTIVFDGTNDYVNGPGISSQLTGNITVEAWIYITSGPSDWVRIIGTGANPSGNRTFGLWYDINRRLLWQRYGATDPSIYPANVLSYNTWYYVAATTSGSSNALYLNGSSIGSSTAAGPWPASNENVTIGSAVGIHTYLTGNISISRIYNRGLSSTEILQNYNAQKSRYGL